MKAAWLIHGCCSRGKAEIDRDQVFCTRGWGGGGGGMCSRYLSQPAAPTYTQHRFNKIIYVPCRTEQIFSHRVTSSYRMWRMYRCANGTTAVVISECTMEWLYLFCVGLRAGMQTIFLNWLKLPSITVFLVFSNYICSVRHFTYIIATLKTKKYVQL
jgi:hypothetical protein